MRPIRQLLAAVIAVTAVLFSAVLISAAPALAHDVAESTSPANGSTVDSVPDSVSITFNNRPLLLGSQIQVKDSTGQNWADGSVEIVDTVVSQKLKPGAPAGPFTVVWRVVSSDSHPIEGSFSFTAKTGSTTSAGSSGAVPTAGTLAPGSTTTPDKAPDASQPFPWSIVGLAVVAVGLLVFLGVTARRKLAGGGDTEDAGVGGAEDTTDDD
ncbi:MULTISPECIES: copper resistance protein CopC [Arthrobacter]|uniref:Copper resistance protein CopC n=1 Tax=Arthrobacter terricola TaxID=2547396 RepID=A0A4R5KU05_9MICC|nr:MULTISPECIES: copper resistance protein CopC [Arthrobacter]MBT8160580.1 copper resistance protein CopC [Arthrobacter sp. GN70]TDF98390.1 copper resistance protein CopC [Arthrobacter terricola]